METTGCRNGIGKETQVGGLTGSTLKLIAIIAMFLDHFSAVFIANTLKQMKIEKILSMNESAWLAANPAYERLQLANVILRGIGRFGFPIFAFLLVEGVIHTRNIKKYIRNMLIFSVVSEVPFDLAFEGTWFYESYQNVFFTLTIGVCVLAVMHSCEKREWKKNLSGFSYVAAALVGVIAVLLTFTSYLIYPELPYMIYGTEFFVIMAVAAVVSVCIFAFIMPKWTVEKRNAFTVGTPILLLGIILAEVLKTDYASWGVFTIFVMYFFRKNKVLSMGLGCVALTIMTANEAPAFLMTIPVANYNGKRGLSMKYFFYAFYPVHLLILYLIAHGMGIL